MIKVAGVELDIKTILEKYPRDSAENEILEKLSKSSRVYEYSSMEELIFETDLRRDIIRASMELYRGRLGFRTFHESKCNEAYWERREDGGFVLKNGVKPADAIRDIFKNTRKYATECATAIVIVFYGAVLEAYSDDLFNKAFPELILMNWTQMDELMGIVTYRKLTDYLPGDCRYFRNPDVNPLTPEWQGENTIYLGGSSYYGHGIGIGTKEKIISALNDNRIEDAEASAYLMDTATRPNFANLYQYKKSAAPFAAATPVQTPATATITASPATPASPAAPASAPSPATAASTPAPATAASTQTPTPAPVPSTVPAHSPTTAAPPVVVPTEAAAAGRQRSPIMMHPFQDHPIFLHPHI